MLRKDYRRDWEIEVKEEYTYCTQADFEAVYARLGLRVLGTVVNHFTPPSEDHDVARETLAETLREVSGVAALAEIPHDADPAPLLERVVALLATAS